MKLLNKCASCGKRWWIGYRCHRCGAPIWPTIEREAAEQEAKQ